jgi:hypothetical protein
VGSDGPRSDQVDISQTSKIRYNGDTVANSTRYQVLNSDGTVFEDEWVYKEGLTRVWSVDSASQIHDGLIDFHYHTARETGARDGGLGGTAEQSGKSSGGFDIQLARDIGLIGKRGSWGIAFSIGMNDISGKTNQSIVADELIATGTYKLNDPIPTVDVSQTGTYYSAPSPAAFSQGGGGVEDSARLSQTAVDPSTGQPLATGTALPTTVIPNAATVTGQWKIKGAYYLMRLGPQFRYYASKRFSFSANAGIAAAYAGSDFDIDETLATPTITGVSLTAQPTFVGTSHKREFMIGGYAEVNTEFWITFRTGLYGGVVYEALGKYKHQFNDAVADVNVGSGLSFRLGVITRF